MSALLTWKNISVLGDQKFWNSSVMHAATRLLLLVHYQNSWVVSCLFTPECEIFWHLLEDGENFSMQSKTPKIIYSRKQIRAKSAHFLSVFTILASLSTLGSRSSSIFSVQKILFHFTFISVQVTIDALLSFSVLPQMYLCAFLTKEGKRLK